MKSGYAKTPVKLSLSPQPPSFPTNRSLGMWPKYLRSGKLNGLWFKLDEFQRRNVFIDAFSENVYNCTNLKSRLDQHINGEISRGSAGFIMSYTGVSSRVKACGGRVDAQLVAFSIWVNKVTIRIFKKMHKLYWLASFKVEIVWKLEHLCICRFCLRIMFVLMHLLCFFWKLCSLQFGWTDVWNATV